MSAVGTTSAADANRTARLEEILSPDAVMATGALSDPAGKALQSLSFLFASYVSVHQVVSHSLCFEAFVILL